MKKMETLLDTLLANSHTLEAALKMLGYSLETLNYVDDKNEIRLMAGHIASGMECLQVYQSKMSNDIENIISELYQ